MDLFVADKNLNKLGVLNDRTSLIWTRRYTKTGEFELHCPLTPHNLEFTQRGNILYRDDDTEAGYINYRNLEQDTTGAEVIAVKGSFLTGYLNRRVVWGTETINGAVEIAMRTLVNNNSVAPTDLTRILPNMILGTLKNYTETADYQTAYKNLSEELENLSAISDLGHRVNLDIDLKKLVFEVFKGFNRTAGQSVNPRCIFSRDYNNILEQVFTESDNNLRNFALIGGVGEGAARKLTTVGTAVGLDRYELFCDQKSLSNEYTIIVDDKPVTMTYPDAVYASMLQGKGREALSTTKEAISFASHINPFSNQTYKTDFDLGDVVTCVDEKWGVTLDTRITEITETYEESGMGIGITFGDELPTLIDKIKQIRKG